MKIPCNDNTVEACDIETSSERYAARFHGKVGAWLLKVQGEATLKLIASCRAVSVLEIGGGHGQLTPYLIHQGHQVTVHGSSDICRERIWKWIESGHVKFQAGDLMHLPFENKSYDVVIAYHLLSHLSDARPFIRELTRIARKTIVVDYPSTTSINGLGARFFWLKKIAEGHTRPYITYSEKSILAIFKEFGFSFVEKYPKYFLPIVVHRIMKWPAVSAITEASFRAIGLTHRFGSPVIAAFAYATE